MNTPRVVTFWEWNSPEEKWLPIAIHEGQKIERKWGGRCDEGYHYTFECYEWPDSEDFIVCETATEAMDCDGRLDTYQTFRCSIDELAAVPADHREDLGPRPPRPAWKTVEQSQRDYTAERMGY